MFKKEEESLAQKKKTRNTSRISGIGYKEKIHPEFIKMRRNILYKYG